MVFWQLQLYDSAIFVLASWTALLSLYFVDEETKLPEARRIIQELKKRNEGLQKTINQDKGNMSFMTNYINELEKLIVDDVRVARKKGKKRNRRMKRKGNK
jgi:predicted  nucleic acid-binding Zn-ribbon protein